MKITYIIALALCLLGGAAHAAPKQTKAQEAAQLRAYVAAINNARCYFIDMRGDAYAVPCSSGPGYQPLPGGGGYIARGLDK